jgi:hypothetical protein
MPNIIDVVASRVSRDLTRGKLASTFKPQPTTAKGLVLGKQLAMIKGTPTTTTLDDSDTVQTIVEFSNIGRPALAVWSPGTASATTPTSSGAAGTTVSNPYVPTTRRVNTVWPVQGGADLGSGDLTLSLASNSITAEMLSEVIVPSSTVDTAIVGDKLEFNVVAGTIDADTIDGYHAAEIMAVVNQFPAGTTTGDVLRWDNAALEWVVEHEPIALAGAIMAPLASMTAVEGATYYSASTKHLLVYTEA